MTDDANTAGTDPLIGQLIGSFQVERLIGEGGMGRVYAARHPGIGRTAAIKILHLSLLSDETQVARFEAEAKAMTAIEHEGVVDVFDVGRLQDGRLYMIMDLLEGETLAERMERGLLPRDQALDVVARTAAALGAAHEKGFVHRDVKPDNVFLIQEEDGKTALKLLDFGVAKLAGLESAMDRLTRTGVIVGTPAYMAPEQIEGEEVDARTDVYALGSLAYELFSGKPAFAGDTLGEVMRKQLLEKPRPLHELVDVPRAVSQVLARAHAKSKDKRWPSTEAMVAALRKAFAGEAVPEAEFHEEDARVRVAREAKAKARLRRPARRTKRGSGALIGAAVAVGVVLAGVALLYLLTREDGDDAGDISSAETAKAAPGDPVVDAPDLEALRVRARTLLSERAREGDDSVRALALRKLGRAADPAALPMARDAIGEGRPELAAAGAWVLGRLGAEEDRKLLQAALAAADPVLAVWLGEAMLRLGDEAGGKVLRDALGSDSPAVSIKAALALADAGDTRAVKPIREMLSESGTMKRSLLLPLLGGLARLGDVEAAEALRGMLEDPDEGTRLRSAAALARIGDASAHALLRDTVADTGSSKRVEAARLMLDFGEPTGASVLREAAADPVSSLRPLALEALGELGDPEQLTLLAEALHGEPESVRIAAAAAILLLAGSTPEERTKRSTDWALAALDDDDWTIRDSATGVLGELDPEVAVPLLSRAAKDERPEVRRSAVKTLGRTRSKAAVPVLEEALGDSDEGVSAAAAEALGEVGDRAAVAALQARSNSDSVLGIQAAASLVQLGDADALATLETALSSGSRILRLAALEGAVRGNAQDLLRATLESGDAAFRFEAAVALAAVGDATAEPLLRASLGKKELAPRAYTALRRLGLEVSDAERPDLMALLHSEDVAIRIDVLSAAESLPWEEAVTLVRTALRDRDVVVRLRALDVVATMEGAVLQAAEALYRMAERDDAAPVRFRAGAALARLAAAPPKPPEPPVTPLPVPEPATSAPTPAASTASATGAEDLEAKAREHATRGTVLLRSGNYSGAIRELKVADGLHRTPEVTFDLAEAYRLEGFRSADAAKREKLLTNARKHYSRFLKGKASGTKAGEARAYVKELDALLAGE